MSKIIEKLKWQEYQRKRELLFDYGYQTGLIRPYNEEEFKLMQQVYYGGLPASIVLLCPKLCARYCLDRSVLLAVALENTDFHLVTAHIDGLSLNPKNREKYQKNPAIALHRFLERKLANGTTWVYDTSEGLVFEKSLYYKMHNPKINKINNREDSISYCDFQDIKNANLEEDKHVLPLLFPLIDAIAEQTESFYKEVLLDEIKRFKEEINYTDLIRESEEVYKRRKEQKC